MSMQHKQLRELIRETLAGFAKATGISGLNTPAAVELLMLTAAQESHCGEYITQLDGGPAKGIFQMEPATAEDILRNFLMHRPALLTIHEMLVGKFPIWMKLKTDLVYAIFMARIHYWRVPDALPDVQDVDLLAMFWKDHYNTSQGKGTWREAVANYRRYAK